MITFVTLRVHRNYILTQIREQYDINDYCERCISSPDAARRLYNNEFDYLGTPCFNYSETFETLPEYTTLRIQTRFEGDKFTVTDAKFSDNLRGVKDFRSAFANATRELVVKILANIVECVRSKDASTLLNIINTLINNETTDSIEW